MIASPYSGKRPELLLFQKKNGSVAFGPFLELENGRRLGPLLASEMERGPSVLLELKGGCVGLVPPGGGGETWA